MMPYWSMLYAGRIFACSNLPQMMHSRTVWRAGLRSERGNVRAEGSRGWLEKVYDLNVNW
jgi:4-hydroxyphenylacetate 3-monooxygenase